MSKKTTAPGATNPFLAKIKKNLALTEQDIKLAQAEKWLKAAIIAANTQISLIETRELPTLSYELEEAQLALETAKENLEEVKYSIATDYQNYTHNMRMAKNAVIECENNISNIKAKITDYKVIVKEHQEYLSYLTA